MTRLSANPKPEERNPAFIEEPKPGPTHLICAICREQFTDYHQHIFSARHKRGVESNIQTYKQVDSVIDELQIRFERKAQESVKHLLRPSPSPVAIVRPKEAAQ